jgi:ribonuclease Z
VDHNEKATENMHSTAKEAATLAAKANVKKLVLTHFSARYEDVDVLVKEASEIHPNVVAAEDLLTIEVPYDQ